MICAIDATHDPNLRSWVKSANQADTDFPIQNLPFGVFQQRGHAETPRIGVAIGDQILDLTACHETGLLQELPESLQAACCASTLNPVMAMGRTASLPLRHHLSQLLRAGQVHPADRTILVSMSEAQLLLPATIGDYTDFYASIFHAANVGKLFRPDNPSAAKLQTYSDRLSRTGIFDRSEWHPDQTSLRSTETSKRLNSYVCPFSNVGL